MTVVHTAVSNKPFKDLSEVTFLSHAIVGFMVGESWLIVFNLVLKELRKMCKIPRY
jgi:hypothetical protein